MTTLLGVPEVVIDRLPVYARTLAMLESQGRQVVSSQELGDELGVTPAQIRKDLSYFGRFGKQGRGYRYARTSATSGGSGSRVAATTCNVSPVSCDASSAWTRSGRWSWWASGTWAALS